MQSRNLLHPVKFVPVQKASTARIIRVYAHQSHAALNTLQGRNIIYYTTSLGRASQAPWNTPEHCSACLLQEASESSTSADSKKTTKPKDFQEGQRFLPFLSPAPLFCFNLNSLRLYSSMGSQSSFSNLDPAGFLWHKGRKAFDRNHSSSGQNNK